MKNDLFNREFDRLAEGRMKKLSGLALTERKYSGNKNGKWELRKPEGFA